jgi:hypothetical protein
MANYYLLNKDEKLLEFQTMETLGSTRITEVWSFTEKRPLGFSGIADWVRRRDYAKHKDHFKKWLRDWQIDTTDGFLQVTHALGINDCLWVKEKNSTLTWDDVSLYRNDFSDVAAHTAFETGLFGLELSTTSPEFTTEGSFPKYWSKEPSGIFLHKAGLTGASNVGLEPYSEYMASLIGGKIAEENGFVSVVPYDLQKEKGQILSTCGLFTDENTGFLPMNRLLDRRHTYTIADILSICADMGFEREAKWMFLIDSAVFNQDRHLGNFGILFDNDTFTIKSFAPLFDFNISMLCNALKSDLANFEAYEEEYMLGHKLGGRFFEVGMELAKDEKLPPCPELPAHPLYNLPEERIVLLEEIFQKNYEKIAGRERNFAVELE